ncbi:MAG: transcriptional regulator [Naasia sp.]|nr:transcriptional regulator [Naasia sp.]
MQATWRLMGRVGRHRGKRRWWSWALLAIAGVLVLGAGTAGVYIASLAASFDNGTGTLESAFPEESSRPAPAATPTDGQPGPAQNILLVGTDTRGQVGDDLDAIRGQRADTIMVAHIPADRKHVYVVSVMRDSWVQIPGHGDAKANAALSFGGMPLLVQTVESLLGSRIDHVAVVDFEGFRGMTDALGGVQVVNEKAFSGSGHSFAVGPISLEGDSALTYVRERYSFTDGDYQRVRNQQAYIKGVMNTVLSGGTLLNPARVSGLVRSIAPYLTVDEGLDSGYIAGLAMQMSSLRAADVSFLAVPTSGTGASADGQSIVNLDQQRLAQLQQAFAADDLAAYRP